MPRRASRRKSRRRSRRSKSRRRSRRRSRQRSRLASKRRMTGKLFGLGIATSVLANLIGAGVYAYENRRTVVPELRRRRRRLMAQIKNMLTHQRNAASQRHGVRDPMYTVEYDNDLSLVIPRRKLSRRMRGGGAGGYLLKQNDGDKTVFELQVGEQRAIGAGFGSAYKSRNRKINERINREAEANRRRETEEARAREIEKEKQAKREKDQLYNMLETGRSTMKLMDLLNMEEE